MLAIQKKFIAYNFGTRTMKPEYIVIHDTGNKSAGATALMHFNYFNGGDRQASADFFVDDHEIIQCVDYTKHYSWHCGDGHGAYGITNPNSIGIELCINSDGNYEKAFQNDVELTAYLAKELGIPFEKIVRHYDASRKNCPQTMNNGTWAKWNEFKAKVKALMDVKPVVAPAPKPTPVAAPVSPSKVYPNLMGAAVVTVAQAKAQLLSVHPSAPVSYIDFYVKWGESEGVRWDLAFAQSLHETDYFKFGGTVNIQQNNFAGLGATGAGAAGASFPDASVGVLAQIQHLKAYASTAPLVNPDVDPRNALVTPRGKSPTLGGLSGTWAADTKYADEIMVIYDAMVKIVVPVEKPVVAPVVTPAPVVAPVVNFKEAAVNYLADNGIITDREGWKAKVDQPAPVWLIMVIAVNLLKKLMK